MKKIGSTFTKIILVLGSLLLSGIVIGLVRESIEKSKATATVNSYCKDMAEQLNTRCPIDFNSWTTIESVTYKNKEMVFKYIIDNDVFDSLSPDGYRSEFVNAFATLIGKDKVRQFGVELKNANVSILLKVHRSNGNFEYDVHLYGSDFIYFRD